MNVAVVRTLQPLRARYAIPLLGRLRLFWQWWCGEIMALMPARIRESIARSHQSLFVEARADEFEIELGSWDRREPWRRLPLTAGPHQEEPLPRNVQQTVLFMPARRALVCRLRLPLAAEENLREVLAFEMDQRTPFTAAEVYYDYLITGRDTAMRQLHVDLVYSPRREVDRLLDALAGMSLDVDVVTSHALEGSSPRLVNLLPTERRSRNRRVRRANVVLAALLGVLLCAAVTVPIVQKNRAIAEVDALADAAAEQAREGNRLRLELERLAETSRFLTQKKQTDLMTVRLIDEVSRVLPDHTSVTRLDLAGNELQLQGQSAASAMLIALIDASPYFANARFRAPVVQVRGTELDRFHLSADIVRSDAR